MTLVVQGHVAAFTHIGQNYQKWKWLGSSMQVNKNQLSRLYLGPRQSIMSATFSQKGDLSGLKLYFHPGISLVKFQLQSR